MLLAWGGQLACQIPLPHKQLPIQLLTSQTTCMQFHSLLKAAVHLLDSSLLLMGKPVTSDRMLQRMEGVEPLCLLGRQTCCHWVWLTAEQNRHEDNHVWIQSKCLASGEGQ